MRFKYTFDVQGRIRPAQVAPIEVDGIKFELILENNFIRKLCLSFEVTENDLPTVRKSTKKGVELELKVNSPRLSEVEEIVRQIEGMLSFWGLESIRVRSPLHEWIPESAEERSRLQLNNFSVRSHKQKDSDVAATSYDLIARTIMVAAKEKKHDVLLAFYRRGRREIENEEYIEAIYNFYFVIESHYAQGKSKNHAVEDALKESPEFIENLKSIISDREFRQSLPVELQAKFESEFQKKDIGLVIRDLIKMRGFLHHYNTKRRINWHPDKSHDYELEAYVLQMVAHNLTFSKAIEKLFAPEIVLQYEEFVTAYKKQAAPPKKKIRRRNQDWRSFIRGWW